MGINTPEADAAFHWAAESIATIKEPEKTSVSCKHVRSSIGRSSMQCGTRRQVVAPSARQHPTPNTTHPIHPHRWGAPLTLGARQETDSRGDKESEERGLVKRCFFFCGLRMYMRVLSFETNSAAKPCPRRRPRYCCVRPIRS